MGLGSSKPYRNLLAHFALCYHWPLFLSGGVVLLLSGVRLIHFNTRWVWPFVLIGVGVAFLLEWPYAQRSAA
jgi:hypothetical protein